MGRGEHYAGAPSGTGGQRQRHPACARIRSRNAFTTFGYAKDYDAIVTVGANGRQAEFALEYERTAKAARKYRRIRREIESETLVAHFVYLASNYHLLNFIAQFF